MSINKDVPEGKDPQLWRIARERAGFKSHFYSYLIINIFLWVVWYFRHGNNYQWNGIPWPLWVTIGWGIGLAFNYVEAYIYPKGNSVEREYDKLKNQNNHH